MGAWKGGDGPWRTRARGYTLQVTAPVSLLRALPASAKASVLPCEAVHTRASGCARARCTLPRPPAPHRRPRRCCHHAHTILPGQAGGRQTNRPPGQHRPHLPHLTSRSAANVQTAQRRHVPASGEEWKAKQAPAVGDTQLYRERQKDWSGMKPAKSTEPEPRQPANQSRTQSCDTHTKC